MTVPFGVAENALSDIACFVNGLTEDTPLNKRNSLTARTFNDLPFQPQSDVIVYP